MIRCGNDESDAQYLQWHCYLSVAKKAAVNGIQGDQIGRICAYWVTVFFGQFQGNYRNSQCFLTKFFRGKSYVLIFTRNWLGYISGEFFKNSSCHPGRITDPCRKNVCIL
jgi:hypothetical protein